MDVTKFSRASSRVSAPRSFASFASQNGLSCTSFPNRTSDASVIFSSSTAIRFRIGPAAMRWIISCCMTSSLRSASSTSEASFACNPMIASDATWIVVIMFAFDPTWRTKRTKLMRRASAKMTSMFNLMNRCSVSSTIFLNRTKCCPSA